MNLSKIIFISIFITFFLASCTSTSVTKHLKKDEFYVKALQESKKGDIVSDGEVKVMFTATYLNNIEEKYNDGNENFIISVYNSINNTKNNQEVNLKLNNEVYTKITTLDNNSEIVKNLPIKNGWADYYLVTFEKINSDNLTIQFIGQDNQEVQLSFQKR